MSDAMSNWPIIDPRTGLPPGTPAGSGDPMGQTPVDPRTGFPTDVRSDSGWQQASTGTPEIAGSTAPATYSAVPLGSNSSLIDTSPINRLQAQNAASAKGVLDASNKASDLQAQADVAQNSLNNKYGAENVKQFEDMYKVVDDHHKLIEAANLKAQQMTERQMATWQQSVADAADTHVHSYWEGASTGGKILGILAAALGGAANGLAGQPGATTAMDRVIQQDMDMQLANMKKKEANADRQGGILRTMIDVNSNLQSAQAAAYAATMDKYFAMAKTMAAKMGLAQNDVNLMQTLATLQQKKAGTLEKVAQLLSSQNAQTTQLQMGVNTSEANMLARLQAEQAKIQAKAGKVNQTQANKGSDVDRAIAKIDEAINTKGDSLPIVEQRDLSEAIAAGLNNSPTRGPQLAERDTAKNIVSGAFGSLSEWRTAAGGLDKKKLQKIRAELLEKQRTRASGNGQGLYEGKSDEGGE